jgi:hypothetical protein
VKNGFGHYFAHSAPKGAPFLMVVRVYKHLTPDGVKQWV